METSSSKELSGFSLETRRSPCWQRMSLLSRSRSSPFDPGSRPGSPVPVNPLGFRNSEIQLFCGRSPDDLAWFIMLGFFTCCLLGWETVRILLPGLNDPDQIARAFQDYVRRPRPPTKMTAITKNRKFGEKSLKIIFSETAGPIGPKLWWNGLQMVLFQNCVQRPRPPTNMATVTKNRKCSKKSFKNYLL